MEQLDLNIKDTYYSKVCDDFNSKSNTFILKTPKLISYQYCSDLNCISFTVTLILNEHCVCRLNDYRNI